jgi:hypothetical protein
VTWVVVTLGLLAALVWALNPRQPKLTPAPLGEPLAVCAKLPREFIPTDIADLGEAPLPTLPREQKFRALARMNAEECPCGCKLSVAACRVNDPTCKTSAELARKIADSTSRSETAARAQTRSR